MFCEVSRLDFCEHTFRYLDGTDKALADRSLGIPSILCQFQGYKQPEKHKHRRVHAESLKAADLRIHSMALFNLYSSSYMKNQRWKAVQEAIYTLATNCSNIQHTWTLIEKCQSKIAQE